MDLSTNYMGLALRNPLVASPSPLSYTLDGVKRLADGGVGAIVMFSLFEEQLREEAARAIRLVEETAESFPEALDYFPAVVEEDGGPRSYLVLLERAVVVRRRSRDREPQRRHPGRVDGIRPRDAGRRRRRDRAEHLLPPR